MQRQWQRWENGVLVIASVALGVAVAVIVWTRSVPLAPVASLTPARPAAAPAHTIPVRQATQAVAAPVVAPAETDLPLQTQIDHLLATHDPADALTAYRLIAECTIFNIEHDRQRYDEAELKHWKGVGLPGFRGMNAREKQHDIRLCGGMTERERERRLDYLAIAVKAGAAGAAVAFANEGPFGDPSALTTRPDDPLVRDWKTAARAALATAAEKGDLSALIFLQAETYTGSTLTDKNDALLYRYALAEGLIYANRYGPNMSLAKTYAADGAVMTSLATGLSAEQLAAETAAAKRIAINEKALREAAQRLHPAP